MKSACPIHPNSKMKAIPNEAQWRRCDHVGEKGGRCKFTRAS